jgi:hypothetical protein
MNGSTLKIGIVYEDYKSRFRAQQLSERVMAELVEFESNVCLWSFDMLDGTFSRSRMTHDALVSDLIILSANGHLELPAGIYEWLENWVPRRRNRDLAMVALFNRHPNPDEIVLETSGSLLKNLAERHGVDFFCETDQSCPVQEKRLLLGARKPSRRSFLPEDVLHNASGWTHWGINE